MKEQKTLLSKAWNIFFYVALTAFVIYFVKQKFIVPKIETNSLQLVDYNGNEITTSDYEGQVLVLNFWQTWCAPCLKEMPSLNEMPQKWNQIKVLAVSDESLEKIQKVKDKYPNIEFVQIKNFSETEVNQFPTTYIFNKKGVKVYSKIGAKDWSANDFIAMLKKNYSDGQE